MAAIDPSAAPEHTGTTNGTTAPRATLKIIYDPSGPGDDDDDDEDSESEEAQNFLRNLLNGGDNDGDEVDESSSDDEEKNGGPSDPSKTKKARQEAAMEQMMMALANTNDESEDNEDVDMDAPPTTNGKINGAPKLRSDKGKGKALAQAPGEDEGSDEETSADGLEEQVICTLDPEKVRASQRTFRRVKELTGLL